MPLPGIMVPSPKGNRPPLITSCEIKSQEPKREEGSLFSVSSTIAQLAVLTYAASSNKTGV